MVSRIFALDNSIRDYAWGSRTAIPQLLGRAPSDRPAAELWLGAHPDAPSRLSEHPDRPALTELIGSDPARLLGARSVASFGDRLPFLMKLLAADHALSIQVHPTLEQARRGFADEEARGVARDSPSRDYRDDNHKPELLCALTDVEAFCGFRPVPATVRLLDDLISAGADAIRPHRAVLTGGETDTAGLRAVFTGLLDAGSDERETLTAQVAEAAAKLAAAGGEFADNAAAIVLAAQDFPGDIGIAVALLLNHVRLRPGEAIYLAAGNVHAYLRGFGVEILASSDNVLRCGLTPKHIDVPELLAIADFTPLADPRSSAVVTGPGRTVYPVPVPDFLLSRLEPSAGPIELDAGAAHLLLVTAGSISVREPAGGEHRDLAQGESVFLAAGRSPISVSGGGTAFVATANPT